MIKRYFNTTGPVSLDEHYTIDPMGRLDREDVKFLIDTKKYFVLHAPRQTGKTSTLLAMMEALNQGDEYLALYVNIEGAQALRGNVDKAITVVCENIANSALLYGLAPELKSLTKQILTEHQAGSALTLLLSQWAMKTEKPIVLMLDEVDSLVGDALISLLRQIRAGYTFRPNNFPQSIILCGVRDVRDYRIQSLDKEIITGGSAFNIKAKSLRMGNFTLNEVKALYQQHTDDTGQPFEDEMFSALWNDTTGQPWLVNALGLEMVWEDKSARDRSTPITLVRYQAARDRLIRSRSTHLYQLTTKLTEPRVHGVIAAMLAGRSNFKNVSDDDIQYVEDLGLIVRKPQIHIANAIYQEIIPRELITPIQDAILHQQSWYLTATRHLDMPKLLAAFQQFYRENSEIWLSGISYKESAPHLILQAFLQRILNGGGRLQREYALGRKRTDLFIEWPVDEEKGFYGEVQRIVIELKIFYSNLDKTIEQCVVQVGEYAEQCGAKEAHVIIFDRDVDKSWRDKIWHQEQHVYQGLAVGVWGA